MKVQGNWMEIPIAVCVWYNQINRRACRNTKTSEAGDNVDRSSQGWP